MAFLIRSKDGRTMICTASADAASAHAMRLYQSGLEVEITDFNGEKYGIAGLCRESDAPKVMRTKILHDA